MNQSKLSLIFTREYVSRIRTKMFIFTTLLAPIVMVAILVIPALMMIFTSDRERTFYVFDESGVIYERLEEASPGKYGVLPDADVDDLRTSVMENEAEGFIFIPAGVLDDSAQPEFFHDGSIGFTMTSGIRRDLRDAIRDEKLERAQAGPEIKAILDQRIGLTSRTLSKTGEEEQDSGILFGIGYFMAFAIYFAMFTYGGIVMRSAIEEKTSRVVEVMTSSVRPIELLMGKVLGIGALGLTQFLIWIVAGIGLLAVTAPVLALIGGLGDPAAGMEAAEAELPFTLPTIGFSVWGGFLVYFLLGYLLYSSIFAAIGSAVDSESDSQQLMMPVIFLILVPILLVGSVANDPTSNLAVISTLIPFFSPILMPVRLAVISVPVWQVVASILILALTFLLMMWLSARIYRVGILMYGKKPSLRELARWVRYK